MRSPCGRRGPSPRAAPLPLIVVSVAAEIVGGSIPWLGWLASPGVGFDKVDERADVVDAVVPASTSLSLSSRLEISIAGPPLSEIVFSSPNGPPIRFPVDGSLPSLSGVWILIPAPPDSLIEVSQTSLPSSSIRIPCCSAPSIPLFFDQVPFAIRKTLVRMPISPPMMRVPDDLRTGESLFDSDPTDPSGSGCSEWSPVRSLRAQRRRCPPRTVS